MAEVITNLLRRSFDRSVEARRNAAVLLVV